MTNTTALHIISTTSNSNAITSLDELESLANKSGSALTLSPSRLASHQIVKLDGKCVAYAFTSETEARAFVLTR